MAESSFEHPVKKDDLAISIRDQYVQLPRSSSKPVDKERCDTLLLFAGSACSKRDISGYLDRDSVSTKTRSMRNYGIVDFILNKDVQKGIEFIVAMREDIFQARKMSKLSQHSDGNQIEISKLNDLDNDLKDRLRDWFCPDMLEIRRISHDNSVSSVLESIVQKEAVHPIQNSQELRDRLGKGKRVFALFSPLLPDKPLVFCHVALTDEVPRTLKYAVANTQERYPKVATFYSITNGEPGLIGLQLGLCLLKRAMQTLQGHFPSIGGFFTLSPMPNFRQWAEAHIKLSLDKGSSTPSSKLRSSCGFHSELVNVCELLGEENPKSDSFLMKLEAIVQSNTGSYDTRVAVEGLLCSLASQYVLQERDQGMAKCMVARFHLGNGAKVHRINYQADLSQKGMNQSFGLMVNYRYDTIDAM